MTNKEATALSMTREDIIKLACKAGLAHFYDSEGQCDGITDAQLVTEDKERDDDRLVEMLAPFAALVAEETRANSIAEIQSLRARVAALEAQP